MTDPDEITLYDVSAKYQERLLGWLSGRHKIQVTGTPEGFAVSGGGESVIDASLEAALNKIIGYRGKRGQLDPDFEERIRAWSIAHDATLTIRRSGGDQFSVELSSGSHRVEASDEDFEIALVFAEDEFGGTTETEPETLAAPTRHVLPATVRQGARTVRDVPRTIRDIEPETLPARTRLFDRGAAEKTLAVPYSQNRRMSFARNRRGSYASWVGDVSDKLEAIGAHFDDASAEYWRRLYQAGFDPDDAVAEFGVQHRESLGIRMNGAPPAPSSRHRSRGPESALSASRRMISESEAERRRHERPFDPEAPREHYAKSHHFAVNHARARHADKDILREVTLGETGYVLVTWDPHRSARGKDMIGYAFYEPGASKPLFEGEDIGVPPTDAIDSDDTLRSIVGWLTLRPGDTDRDYFDTYTEAQMDFAQSDAEELSMYSMRAADLGGEAMPLVDVA